MVQGSNPCAGTNPQLNSAYELEERGVRAFGYGVWANTGMDVFNFGHTALAFYDIPDVTRVYGLITEARTRSI
jgi:hypothetical protein